MLFRSNSKTGEPDWFFGSTSNFNKILRNWTGADADTCKWKSFSAKLMRTATPCYVNIEHQEDKKDATKVYSRIDSIKPVKGSDTFKPKREIVSWTFGMEGLDSLPGNIKKKIDSIPVKNRMVTNQDMNNKVSCPTSSY